MVILAPMPIDSGTPTITATEYRDRIAALEAQRADQLAEVQKVQENVQQTERLLAWWREGQALYGFDDAPDDRPIDIAPNGKKPVLKTAIFQIMREARDANGKVAWSPAEMSQALGERGWMPNGASANHIVRSRLSTLCKDGKLERASYGHYALPSATEGALTL